MTSKFLPRASDNNALRSRLSLCETVNGFPNKGFAVIDGAAFDDLPARLLADHLVARSLFLEQANTEIQKAGPWLVSLDQDCNATEKVLALNGDAVVFWRCDAGETTLYRHLRTINMVLIPNWAADGAAEPPLSVTHHEAYEAALFRHWDPDVLGVLMPCLDAAQFARTLGPAQEIAFVSESFGGLKRVIAEKAWPMPSAGMLTIHGEQCIALVNRRSEASRQRIARYLQEYAPDQTREIGDAGLAHAVSSYEAQARNFGVCDEDAIGLWSYMQVTSQSDLSKDRYVKSFLVDLDHGATPRERIEPLFDLRERVAGKRHKFSRK